MKRRPKDPAPTSAAEEDFFSSPAAPEGVADEDEVPEAPGRPPLHRVILTVAVVASLGWLCTPLLDEVRYHFSDVEIVDLGDAAGLASGRVPPLGAYVRVRGVLGNKAATLSGAFRPGSLRRGPVQVRQLLGSALFVEFDQDALADRYTPFTRITVEGRVASLGPESEIAAVRGYFKDRFGAELPKDARVIVVGERPGEMWRYPITFGVALLLACASLFFLVRRSFVRA